MTMTDRHNDSGDRAMTCTVVICHGEKTKEALYDIIGRMQCDICEVTSLADLLGYLESSDFTYLQFAEDPENEGPRNYVLQTLSSSHRRDGQTSVTSPGFSRKTDLMTLGEIEEIHIRNTLLRSNWRFKTAARELGIDRTTLYRKMKKYGIEKGSHKKPE